MAATLSPLAKYALALLLTYAGPGRSVNSREVVPECGTDKNEPTCDLKKVCGDANAVCLPPQWSKARGGWARAESKEAAAKRYEKASRALVRTAVYLTRCTDENGVPDEECTPLRWPQGPRSLAMAALSASYWESGYREDIMFGYPPVGRGADGEVCVMQVLPKYARDVRFSKWLIREGFINLESDNPEDHEIKEEDAVRLMLGDDEKALSRCYETGMRILAMKRWYAAYKCKGDWAYSMYAFYGTGNSCSTKSNALGDWALDRSKSYHKFMKKWPDRVPMPDWAVPMYGIMPGQRAPSEEEGGIKVPKWRKDKPSRALPPGEKLEVIEEG